MTPVRLEPAALRSRVKHSTTEPLSDFEGLETLLISEELEASTLFEGLETLSIFDCLSLKGWKLI